MFKPLFKKISLPLAQLALFVVYVWFGILKVLGLSPATPLVQRLFERTIGAFGISFETFIIFFGLFEVAIGVMFLFRKAIKVTIPLFLFHMILTAGPLVLLIHEAWTGFLVPTLEGQYIIKNLALLACAAIIVSNDN